MSVTAPAGFSASGLACGIKPDGGLDLALVTTADASAVAAAAVFTLNQACAAPVRVSRAHLEASRGRTVAVVLNSGNANATTGAAGIAVAEGTCALVAEALGCRAEEVLVCSTGLIGIPLPLAPIESGVGALVASRAGTAEAAARAAEAIRTTDTHRKEVVVRNGNHTIGGMAKGAAMLAPNMATMLAVLTTDAALTPEQVSVHLRDAVSRSFNTLSVDGCTSTNDTVILLASGLAGPVPSEARFAEALTGACADLAGQMAADAEGATKVVRVSITGAVSDSEAALAARKVAQSQLVKCSLYGEDPYWGRIVSEIGSAGVSFELGSVTVAYGGVVVARNGIACEHDVDKLEAHMAGREIELEADLGLGTGQATVLTNDLSPAYIAENMRTS